MNDFKVGDKVIVRNDADNNREVKLASYIGKTLTVAATDNLDFVGFNEFAKGPHGVFCGWSACRFDLAPALTALRYGDVVVWDESNPKNNGQFYSRLRDGAPRTVIDTRVCDGQLMVKLSGDNTYGFIYAYRFKLAPVTSFFAPTPIAPFAPALLATWTIMLRENGKLAPSAAPREFVSEAQAIKVAKKMAEQHTGEFVVFKSIAVAIVPAAVAASVKTFA